MSNSSYVNKYAPIYTFTNMIVESSENKTERHEDIEANDRRRYWKMPLEYCLTQSLDDQYRQVNSAQKALLSNLMRKIAAVAKPGEELDLLNQAIQVF